MMGRKERRKETRKKGGRNEGRKSGREVVHLPLLIYWEFIFSSSTATKVWP